jgi:hypothetical protein
MGGHIVLSAILDPKTNLPETLVNFATKQLVGVLIYLLQARVFDGYIKYRIYI